MLIPGRRRFSPLLRRVVLSLLFVVSPLSLLSLLSVGLTGCKKSNALEEYLNNIPEEEEINASLYHYELIVGDMRDSYSNQDYYQVFNLYEKYLSVFFEASVSHEDELLYWVGKSVQAVVGEGLKTSSPEGSDLFDYLKADKKRKGDLGIEFDRDYVSNKSRETLPELLSYQSKHFIAIVNNRNDYEWEKMALREIYSDKFLPNNEKNLKHNLENGSWLVTRYPDLFPSKEYQAILARHIDLENIGKLSKKFREQWDKVKGILTVNQWRENRSGDFPPLCFPVSQPVVVYNRSHWISSRNLVSLALWEPFQVSSQGVGEDGQLWYSIIFAGDREGFIDSENYTSACVLGSSATQISPEMTPETEKYLLAYREYLAKNFLGTVEGLSDLLYGAIDTVDHDREIFLTVRSWTLMHQTLKEIAARGTSINNPFTRFAVGHPDFFVISRDKINLEVGDYFLKKVIEYDSNSFMLQYFDGLH